MYNGLNNLNQLDLALPLDDAPPSELAAALREVKTVLAAVLAVSMKPDGSIRSLDGSRLSANSVGTEQYENGSITLGKLAHNSVTTENIVAGSITSALLSDGCITELKYGAGSIPTAAYKVGTIPLTAFATPITEDYIASSGSSDSGRAIGTNHLKNLSVTSEKVAAVELAKLAGGNPGEMLMNVSGVWTAIALTGALSYSSGSGFAITSPVTFASFGDLKSRGSQGGTTTANTWVQRDLGEIADPGSIMTFSGNAFTLPVGKYLFVSRAPACAVGKHQARLKVNKGATIEIALWGSSQIASGAGVQNDSVIVGVLDNTENTWSYEIEHWCENSTGSTDLGSRALSDNTTVYT